MRNGLAIAGMAGGLFFLGQAVASADTGGTQTADASTSTNQANTSTNGGGGGANLNESDASAKNVDVTKVESTVTGGNGGVNTASVNTGIVPGGSDMAAATSESDHHDGDHKNSTTVDVSTGNVSLTQNANGGSVNGSGNIAVAGTGSQTATASNTVSQSNSSTGDDHHNSRDHHNGNYGPGGPSASQSDGGSDHHGDGNSNSNESSSDATNIHKVTVDSTVTGGDGGVNNADINTGIVGNTFYCPAHSTCTYNFTTGNVTVYQNANGGDVNNSGNIGIGAPVPGSACSCPEKAAPAAAVRPTVKPAVKPAVKSAALSSAQPSGQLAFTGSDVSLPLTVGLLALVAGLGLTAAGRRRETV